MKEKQIRLKLRHKSIYSFISIFKYGPAMLHIFSQYASFVVAY